MQVYQQQQHHHTFEPNQNHYSFHDSSSGRQKIILDYLFLDSFFEEAKNGLLKDLVDF